MLGVAGLYIFPPQAHWYLHEELTFISNLQNVTNSWWGDTLSELCQQPCKKKEPQICLNLYLFQTNLLCQRVSKSYSVTASPAQSVDPMTWLCIENRVHSLDPNWIWIKVPALDQQAEGQKPESIIPAMLSIHTGQALSPVLWSCDKMNCL